MEAEIRQKRAKYICPIFRFVLLRIYMSYNISAALSYKPKYRTNIFYSFLFYFCFHLYSLSLRSVYFLRLFCIYAKVGVLVELFSIDQSVSVNYQGNTSHCRSFRFVQTKQHGQIF